jgi:hypothetical protein
MSTGWSTAAILGGAVLVAIGAWLTQAGWNLRAEALERRAFLEILVETCGTNRGALAPVAATADPARADTLALNPTTRAVESAVLDSALTSGVFLGRRFDELRQALRSARDAAVAYNGAATRQFASRQQVAELAQAALDETVKLEAVIGRAR